MYVCHLRFYYLFIYFSLLGVVRFVLYVDFISFVCIRLDLFFFIFAPATAHVAVTRNAFKFILYTRNDVTGSHCK